MKRYLKDYLILLIISGLIIAADQVSKYYVRTLLSLGQSWSPWDWLAPYARFVHWYNTGAAFGLFQGQGTVFGIFAVIVAVAILYYFPRVPSKEWILRLAMILQFAGALGNLIDRLTVGHVTDFISIGTFPVFNIADSSITIGTGIMLFGLWLQERANKRAMQNNLYESETQEKINPEAPI